MSGRNARTGINPDYRGKTHILPRIRHFILPAKEVQSPGFSLTSLNAPDLMVDLAGYRDSDGHRDGHHFAFLPQLKKESQPAKFRLISNEETVLKLLNQEILSDQNEERVRSARFLKNGLRI